MAADASAPPAFAFHDRFAAASPTKPAASSAAAGSSSLAASSSAPTLDFDFGDFTNFDSSAAFPAFSVAPALASSKAYAAPPPPSQPQPSPSVAALEAAVADAEEQEPDDGAAAAAADAERASRDAEQVRQRAAAAQAAQAAQRAPVVPQQQPQQAPQQPAAAPSSSTDDPFSSANMYASPPRKSARPAPPSGPSGYNNGSPGAGPLPQPPRLNTAESHSSASMYSSDPAAPPAAALERMSISSARPAPPQPQPQPQRREPRPEQEERARPSSFFGMEQPTASVDAAGFRQPLSPGVLDAARPDQARGDAESAMSRSRPSSFFGVEAPAGSSRPGAAAEQNGAQSQAARIAAYHRGEAERSAAAGNGSAAGHGPAPSGNYSTLAGGTGNGPMPGPPSGRPASIAPTLNSGALLDHSHLRPGQQAALLSHNKTLELYRQNAKKTNDPNLIYELAVFMIDASKTMGGNDAASGGSGGSGSGSGGADGAPGKEESARDELVREAVGLLKKIAERGHPDAQYFLADCYANGIGSPKGKQDFDHAYPLFVLAAKHGHADAAYRAGTCYEKGWGCRKDAGKALQFYRKAAAQSHPGAMYRLATAELNGELGLKKSAREGVKWLKRSAEASTPEFPHALHELALLHERGIDNIVFVDPEYACELLAQAGEMGYAPSAYKLGVNYEYGRMGCPQDAGLSIHMYNIAAQQNHREACFALTAWYLVGAPGILPQSDTEAYLWAKKAAEQGLAKAEYAVGYFTEMGIGTVKDVREARAWYRAAAEHGDKRANQRLAALGAQGNPTLAGIGATPASLLVNGGAPGPHMAQAALAAQTGGASNAFAAQPPNAPFPGQMGDGAASQMPGGPGGSYPTPMAMRTAQTAARQSAYEHNVAAVQAQQHAQQQQQQRGPPRGDPRLSQQPQQMRPPSMQPPPQMRPPSTQPPPHMRPPSTQAPPHMRPPSMQPPPHAPAPYAAGPMSPGRGGPPPQQAYPSYPSSPIGPPGAAAAGAPAAAPPVPDKKKGWFGRA